MKDNIPTDRLPLVTLLLIAGGVAGHLVLHAGGTLQLLADALFLAIFGPSVEDSMSRVRFLAFCLLGAAAAAGVQLGLAPGSAVASVAASGAVAAVVGGHALLYRGARVVSVLLVPTLFRLFELPAWILVGAWLALQPLLSGWDACAAQAAGFAVGLLTIRAFAQRRKVRSPSAPAGWVGSIA
jgi:membrane associated rhomboid family serine protease